MLMRYFLNLRRRRHLGFGAKPPAPKQRPWRPHRPKPWYRDEGNLLALVAVLCAALLSLLIRQVYVCHIFR